MTIHEDSDGYMTLMARPPMLRQNSLSSSLPSLYDEALDEALKNDSTASVEEAGQSDSELEKSHNSCIAHDRSYHR